VSGTPSKTPECNLQTTATELSLAQCMDLIISRWQVDYDSEMLVDVSHIFWSGGEV